MVKFYQNSNNYYFYNLTIAYLLIYVKFIFMIFYDSVFSFTAFSFVFPPLTQTVKTDILKKPCMCREKGASMAGF